MVLRDERVATEALVIYNELQLSEDASVPYVDARVAASFALKDAVARGEYAQGVELIHSDELGEQILRVLCIDEESSFKRIGEI